MSNQTKGFFTMPGESGYEALTLDLANRWGADVIRDSDGTQLSDEIINAGYGIYSTICIIRDHNAWAKENLDKLQQTFLITDPVLATANTLTIPIMKDFFAEQFSINDSIKALEYWEVYDRTTNTLVAAENWQYEKKSESVVIHDIEAWHQYTVSFLAYRIWEEISMYNHTTNNWDKEHLMQIDPMYPETQNYLLAWMKNWCKTHPETTVVRFTSMFYNFVWIWGSDENNRHRFTDWGSYDYTVSLAALEGFEKAYGYKMSAEDFVNGGKFHVSHMPVNKKKKDWMAFINNFVIEFGRKLIDIAHDYDKKAYVFYDDSWVGIEPYNDRFVEFGFDGLIKCVFSGFEARLCSGVDVETHEIRLHPYLFPVGLGGAPTFMEGGNPTLDAKNYWINIRRALLREPIDRIGLGGYLHLVEAFPDFVDYIEKISDEFRTIKTLHASGKPYVIKTKVAVLHSWGHLRSWTLSGHFHETFMHDLMHINEALSGMPVDVTFIDFEDVRKGKLKDVDLVINAGFEGSAWSGGGAWNDSELIGILTKWVYEGGAFVGVNEPTASQGYDHSFRLSHILGVDLDNGERVSHGRWNFDIESIDGIDADSLELPIKEGIYLTDGKAKVIAGKDKLPTFTVNEFGKGKGIYMTGFDFNFKSSKILLDIIRYAGGESDDKTFITDNYNTECTYYPESKTLVIINNSDTVQDVIVDVKVKTLKVTIEAFDTQIIDLSDLVTF